mgnify:CR=1 FL=1
MIQYILIPAALSFAAGAHAACVTDSMEPGDTGPGSTRVCESLESQYPGSDLAVVDREIHSGARVSIEVSVDGHARSLTYRLVGADWVLEAPQVAGAPE